MRTFFTLDSYIVEADVLSLASSQGPEAAAALRREGDYLAISASYGPLEVALRPRYAEFTFALSHLRPVEGLTTARQVGTNNAYIGLGLRPDGTLLLRPTLVSDAAGHVGLNMMIAPSTVRALFAWLHITIDGVTTG